MPSSTDDNPCECNDTEDNVFLPSYQDYINHDDYGFDHSENATNTRCCKTIDWARARGAFYNNWEESYLNNSHYWTRSPYYSDDGVPAWHVQSDGSLAPSDCYGSTTVCVLPFQSRLPSLKTLINLITTPRDRSGFLYKGSLTFNGVLLGILNKSHIIKL